MKLTTGNPPIFPRSKHYKIPTGSDDRLRWKDPLLSVSPIIGETPTAKIQRVVTFVIQFDSIDRVTILIQE